MSSCLSFSSTCSDARCHGIFPAPLQLGGQSFKDYSADYFEPDTDTLLGGTDCIAQRYGVTHGRMDADGSDGWLMFQRTSVLPIGLVLFLR